MSEVMEARTTEQTTARKLKTYQADPAHSSVGFTVRHLGFTKVHGKFEEFDVKVTLDPSDLETLQTTATIQAKSITTGVEDRDKHLRSEDFFEVEQYPTLSFRSDKVNVLGDSEFELEGELTIHGTTKRVTLEGTYHGVIPSPFGDERVAFEAETTINRKEFGLNWHQVVEAGGVVVADKVKISLEIQAAASAENSDDRN